jgi:hypothetical protein
LTVYSIESLKKEIPMIDRKYLKTLGTAAAIAAVLAVTLTNSPKGKAVGKGDDTESRIQIGLAIAPVPLNLEGRNRALVGLGSYIVNAQIPCTDCHTRPSVMYKPGGNPFLGQPEQLNTDHYLAGGRVFPPTSNPLGLVVTSRNITPNAISGLPADLTFEQFQQAFQEGVDFDGIHPRLQVMPWPLFGKMNARDVRAVYEYLSAIPHKEP